MAFLESFWRGLGLCSVLGLPSEGQEALWALRAAKFSARRRRFGGHLGLQKKILGVMFRFSCVLKRLVASWMPKLQKDAKKTDQLVRGVLSLPKGIGKKMRVAVFATGDDLELAKKSGADIFGGDDLVETVKAGTIDFDKCVSTPDMMPKVGSLGQILGPKGLMPNPKLGTVTKNISEAVKNIKSL